MKRKYTSFQLWRRIVIFVCPSLTLCLFAILITVQQINRNEQLRYNDEGLKPPSLKIPWDSKVRYGRENSQSNSVYKGQARSYDKQSDKLRLSIADTFALQLWQFPFSCKEIQNITIVSELGRGYTKTVQKGVYNGIELAVKSIQPWSRDIVTCMERGRKSKDECINLSKYKLIKELLLLQQLKHPNIVKLLGFCWRNEVNSPDISVRGLTVITELGETMGVLKFVQMPWEDRFKVSMDVARLVHYMAHSPLGSLLIRDFRFQQFVRISGVLKLTDLDDVDNEEPGCMTDQQCIVGTSKANRSLPCVSGRCEGFNVLKNLASICNLFLRHMLIPGSPASVRDLLEDVLHNLQLLRINSEQLVQQLEHVVGTFTNQGPGFWIPAN